MATQKKKKSYVEQVLSGEYEYTLTGNNKSNSDKTTAKTTSSNKTSSKSYTEQVLAGEYEYTLLNQAKKRKEQQSLTQNSQSSNFFNNVVTRTSDKISSFLLGKDDKEDIAPVKPTVTTTTTTNKDGYNLTGKTYGDYFYQGYAENKDRPIVEKDGKYYVYYEDAPEPARYRSVDQMYVLTTAEADKKQYEEAVIMGYRGSKGDVRKISNQIKLDTANLSKEEYEDYAKDLRRQEADAEEDLKRKNKVRYGGAGLKGTLGELEYYKDNLTENIDENVVEPIKNAPESYKLGKMSEELGMEAYKSMMGEENNYEELKKEYDKYAMFNQDIATDDSMISQSIQSMPNQWGGFKAGVKGGGVGSIIGGILGGGIGYFTGNTGKGTLIGAKYGGGAGYTVGQMEYTYKLEAGLQYQTLIEMGVPEDIAREEAKKVGTTNALIEGGESLLDLVTLGRASAGKELLKQGLLKKYGLETVESWALNTVVVNPMSEGLEEGLQEYSSIQGEKRATEKAGIDRDDSQDAERIWGSAKVGAFSGLMFGGATAVTTKGVNAGVNKVTSNKTTFTQNEQAVIDKEVENRVAEAEKNGKELTTKEKNEIKAEVIEDLENGYISTDSIENTLGGDTYTSLNEIRENKSKIEQEINELENKPYAQLTVKENDRLKALREELSTIDTNTLETQLQSEMDGKIANDNRLQRSYVEKYNRSQKFTRNESEKSDNANINDFYTSMEEADINNTKKTHDFGSFVSNIIKDKGIKARAVNYDILVKEGRIYKDTDGQYKFIENGKKTDRVANINGFKENGVLNINMQSSKAFEMTVGHEIGEFIKDSDSTAYQSLKDIAIELGKADGSYSEGTLESYIKAYGELTDDATDEYVNDKLGELFDNDQFVTRISENRSLLRKIIDELKYLVEYATAGSSEKRKLLSLQHKLENKFREVYKKTDLTKESSEDTRFALAYFKNSNVGKDQLKRLKTASELRKAGYTKEDIWYRTGVEYNEQAKDISFYVDDLEINPDAKIRDGKTYKLSEVMKDGKLFETYPFLKDTEITIGDVLKIAEKEGETNPQYLKELEGIKGATLDDGGLLLNSSALDNIDQANNVLSHEIQHLIQAHEGYGVDETVYFATDKDGNFYMKEASKGDSLLAYRKNPDEIEAEVTRVMNAMTKDQRHRYSPETIKKEILAYYDKHNNAPIKVNKFLAELESKPKVSYSLSTDNQGRTLTKEQQEFFKDSKVRDEDGTLIQVFHTTTDKVAQFNEFNPVGTDYYRFGEQVVNFFTDSKEMSGSYANQYYEMADTSKFSNVEEVRTWLKENNSLFDEYDIKLIPESGAYYITSNGIGKIIFENETDLLKNAKQKFYEYNKQFGSSKGQAKYQYEGYANITNPYVIDAQGEEWNSVEYGENTKTTLLQHTLTEEEKTSLVELAQESRKKYNQSEETINKIDKFIHNLEPMDRKIYYYYDYFTGDYENGVDLNTDTEQKIYTMYMKELVKREDWQSYVNNKEITANVYNNLERIKNAKVEYEGKEMPMSEFREMVWNTEKNRNRYSEEYFEKNFSYDIVDKLENIDIRMTDFGSKNIENYQKIFKIAEEGFTNVAIEKQFGDTKTTNDIVKRVLEMNQDGANYDGVIIKNTVDYGGKASTREPANLYITFNSNQFKSIENENPTDDADWRYSLGIENEVAPTKNPNLTYAEDVRLEVEETIAPLKQEIAELKETLAPIRDEINPKALTEEDLTGFYEARDNAPILDAPPEVETVYDNLQDSISMDKKSLKQLTKNIQSELGLKRQQVAELEGIIQDFSRNEVGTREDLFNTIKEHFSEQDIEHRNEELIAIKGYLRNYPIKVSDYLKTEYKDGFNKVRQQNFNKLKFYNEGTEVDVAYDELSMMFPGYFPDDITNAQDQLNKIIEVANQDIIEVENFVLDNATVRYVSDHIYDSIQDYRLDELKKMVDKQTKRPIDESLMPPIDEELAPITKEVQPTRNTIAETKPVKKQVENEVLKIKSISKEQQATNKEIAEILDTEPTNESDRNKRKWAIFKANVLDKGAVFEDLSLKNKNRELMGKWDYTLTSESRGQNIIGNGHYQYDRATKQKVQTSKSLNDIRQEVDNTGLTKQFYEYVYHKHNVDRMTLDSRFGTENKPVFGEGVTASKSQAIVNKYEMQHPEFIDFAQDVYDYVNADRQELVNNGVISQETADLWQQMYPHYVPTRRTTDKGLDINVPLDTGRTGINAPVKQATGGNADILPLFDTMAMRTLQTQRATAKNSFGIELKNTLGTDTIITTPTVDEVIDSIDAQEELLQEGKKGAKPTFTVFENGEKVTFTITKDMYDAMKPLSDSSLLSKTIKPLNVASNIRRGLITEYNPVFMLTNAIKDVQDVFINSQHSARTYANIPEAYAQILSKGYWYQEYVANGGQQNSYFDSQENTFKPEAKGFKKVITTPFRAISKINNFIEMTPRLAEYMASRKQGKSVEVSMLDASRVTTNFKAGGDVTKFLNRNGFTFLNASVQGFNQQVRNFREANANGFKGWVKLASKFALAGVPAMILNNLVWEDDEEYDELSDYVKQNYYIVGKYGDGKFIRIPKGRTVAVIQNGFEQMEHLATGDDEADFKTFFDLFITNLAPSNPADNNIIAPIIQVANNKTWYGDNLVPTRLQDNPVELQYDESTDMFSRWLGETFGVSPYKVNYLIDQYSGGLGDVFLPMMTPEAESGDDSFEDKLFAPVKNKFTADSVMNNQNVSDFYEKSEELTIQANKTNATDEDILRNKYMNSVKAEMNELYAEKREIQNSNLSDSEKYRQVREKQKEINNLSKNALSEYDNARIYDNYAQVGDRHYRINGNGDWTKINDKQLAKQERMTTVLNINGSDYWRYNDDIYDIKADKDSKGESISGSRKKKVISYVNSLDLSVPQKAILIRQEYPSYDDYNYDIINYVNSLDISYEDKVSILTELDMEVDKNGNIRW